MLPVYYLGARKNAGCIRDKWAECKLGGGGWGRWREGEERGSRGKASGKGASHSLVEGAELPGAGSQNRPLDLSFWKSNIVKFGVKHSFFYCIFINFFQNLAKFGGKFFPSKAQKKYQVFGQSGNPVLEREEEGGRGGKRKGNHSFILSTHFLSPPFSISARALRRDCQIFWQLDAKLRLKRKLTSVRQNFQKKTPKPIYLLVRVLSTLWHQAPPSGNAATDRERERFSDGRSYSSSFFCRTHTHTQD